jgi:hypothetical protein
MSAENPALRERLQRAKARMAESRPRSVSKPTPTSGNELFKQRGFGSHQSTSPTPPKAGSVEFLILSF